VLHIIKNMNKIIKRVISLIRNEYFILSLILLGSVLLRLYKISNPILDWHSFRQVDTASVTKVFYEEGVNLFIPRYHDISSTQSGIFNPQGYRFVEFPIFNLIHLEIYKLFPFIEIDIVGRMVSIFSAVLSTVLIFLITRRLVGKPQSLIAAGLYAILPYNIYFTRVILPEPFAVTFGLAAIWFFVKYLDKNSIFSLLLSAASFSLAILVKPYMLFYGIPIFYLHVTKKSLKSILKSWEIYLWGIIVLVPFVLWRVWMDQFPEGIPFWKWTFNGDGIRFRPAFWKWIFGERLTAMMLGYLGIIPFTFGILSAKAKKLFPHMFLIGAFVYVSVFATANVRHDYYQTIIVPSVVIMTAVGIVEIWRQNYYSKKIARVLVIVSVAIMIITSYVQIKEFYKINRPELVEAGNKVDEIVPKDALVIAPYNGDTAFLYQTNRKGWPVVDRPIDELIDYGAQYFVSVDLNHYQTIEFSKRFEVIFKASNYVIIDLTKSN